MDDAIEQAYIIVGDTALQKRNDATAMRSFLNRGVRDLKNRRPYLFTDEDVSKYVNALAHYIASCVFEQDATDEHNANLMAYHRKIYMETT